MKAVRAGDLTAHFGLTPLAKILRPPILGDGRLAGVRNVFSAVVHKDPLRAVTLFAVFGVGRCQNVSVLNLPLIPFGLILWNAHANERAGKTSSYRAPAALLRLP